MICLPYSVLAVGAFLMLVALVTWQAPALLEWVLERISTPMDTNPVFLAHLRASIAEAAMAKPHQDPAEARLYGAMREITPAMRRDWQAADEAQRKRRRLWRGIALLVSLGMWWVVLRLVGLL